MTTVAKMNVEPWVGLLTGPVVFLLDLQVNLSIVSWVCSTGQFWMLHLTTLLSLIATAGAGWLAWRTWHRATERIAVPVSGPLAPDQFLGFIGVLTSGFFLIVLIALWTPVVLLGSCP
jgi:hypothetical protein